MATVLITGTSTGIGFATALAFGRAGHKVAAAMRSPVRAPELAKVVGQEKLDVTVCTMDVDVDASVSEAMGRIAKEIGPIDVLVNNAGIDRMGSVEELPLHDFSCRHGDQLFRRHSLRSGRFASHATKAERLHRQYRVRRRAHRHVSDGSVRGVQVRLGGPQ